MKRIRKWALRLALNRHQRAWIWNAIIYSRNRYTRRGDYESAAIMQEIIDESGDLFFHPIDPIFGGNRRGATMIHPSLLGTGKPLPSDVKQIIGEDGEPDVELNAFKEEWNKTMGK